MWQDETGEKNRGNIMREASSVEKYDPIIERD